MLTLHLEGATIDELRAKAIETLGLKLGLDRAEAAAHVEKLQAEPIEDTAAPEIPEKAEEQVTEATAAPAEKVKRTRKTKEKPAATTVVSDFAKEVEAAADAEDLTQPTKLSLENVRTAFDAYVQKFGVAAAQVDGPILLGRVYGNTIARIKDVPEDDQGKLGRVIAAVEGAILTNEFKRETVQ